MEIWKFSNAIPTNRIPLRKRARCSVALGLRLKYVPLLPDPFTYSLLGHFITGKKIISHEKRERMSRFHLTAIIV